MQYMDLEWNYRKYGTRCFVALLRISRNLFGHEGDVDGDIRQLYDGNAMGFEDYLCKIFPYLRIVVFDVVQKNFVKGGKFDTYFNWFKVWLKLL